jgi:hypothetical protein
MPRARRGTRDARTAGVLYTGTEVVEFSPSEELGRTMEVVAKKHGGDAFVKSHGHMLLPRG